MGDLLSNLNNYRTRINPAINNFQKIFGLSVSVYRLTGSRAQKVTDAYGSSRVSIKDPDQFTFLKMVYSLAVPTELYKSLHSNASDVELTIADNDLIIGDLVRFNWTDNNTLDYYVSELPDTYGTMFYKYKLASNFNTIKL